jgi:heme O synthase-like polyprenyltransferase
MVLATREVPGIQPMDWIRLTVWTLIGGSLAAGAANAINQYLDRDIDERGQDAAGRCRQRGTWAGDGPGSS